MTSTTAEDVCPAAQACLTIDVVGVKTRVTFPGIRAGEPGALAALCERRGPSVLAYCELAAAPGYAIFAAADAVASFRRSTLPADPVDSNDGERLLRLATREAAARCGVNAMAAHVANGSSAGCTRPEADLLHHFDAGQRWSDDNVGAQHLAECHVCRATLQRLEAAERAYERPPSTRLPPAVADQLVTALVMAAPVRMGSEDAASVRAKAVRMLTGEPARGRMPTPAVRPAPPAFGDPQHNGASAPSAEPAAGSPDDLSWVADGPSQPSAPPPDRVSQGADLSWVGDGLREGSASIPQPASDSTELSWTSGESPPRPPAAGFVERRDDDAPATKRFGWLPAGPRRGGPLVLQRRRIELGAALLALVVGVVALAMTMGSGPAPTASDSASQATPSLLDGEAAPATTAAPPSDDASESERAERQRASAAAERRARRAREERSARAAERRRAARNAAAAARATPAPASGTSSSTPPPPPQPPPPPTQQPPPAATVTPPAPPPSSGGIPGGEFSDEGET